MLRVLKYEDALYAKKKLTWYVRPGFKFSVNLAVKGAPRSIIWGVFRRIPIATWYRSNSVISLGPDQLTSKESGPANEIWAYYLNHTKKSSTFNLLLFDIPAA